MSITVKKVDLSTITPEEGSEIVELLNAYATDAMGGGEPLKEYTKAHLVEELVKRKNIAHIFVARYDNQPAGLANCFEGFSTFHCKSLLNIHDFLVIPQFRGKGISKVLMQAVEEFARSIGCVKLTLEVLEGNHIAQALYLKVGFQAYELDPTVGRALFWEKKLL